MLGQLELHQNQWWVLFNDKCSSQLIDESINTSSFKEGKILEFEIHLASNAELTKTSANKFRAYPV